MWARERVPARSAFPGHRTGCIRGGRNDVPRGTVHARRDCRFPPRVVGRRLPTFDGRLGSVATVVALTDDHGGLHPGLMPVRPRHGRDVVFSRREPRRGYPADEGASAIRPDSVSGSVVLPLRRYLCFGAGEALEDAVHRDGWPVDQDLDRLPACPTRSAKLDPRFIAVHGPSTPCIVVGEGADSHGWVGVLQREPAAPGGPPGISTSSINDSHRPCVAPVQDSRVCSASWQWSARGRLLSASGGAHGP